MPELPILSVSELSALTNQILESAFPRVVVTGEIANYRVSKGTYVHFDIKDEESSLECFMTVYQLRTILSDGMRVRLTVRPRLTPWGGFSLVVHEVELAGEGTIKRAQEALRQQLEAEGLFDPSRKRSLPAYPERIALVTSTESAAYQDFLKVSGQRWRGLHIQVADVQVQGSPAADQIVEAIACCSTLVPQPDVLVMIRGGGSADDLQVFSTEAVTRAIATSRIPTLVAIGHEKDISLAELAADARASTPSNAAELLVPDHATLLDHLATQSNRLDRSQQLHRQHVMDYLREQTLRLERHSGLNEQLRSVEILADRLQTATSGRFDDWSRYLAEHSRLLGSYDPRAALRRGYALVRQKGTALRDTQSLRIGQLVMVELAHGNFEAQIRRIQS